jgi:hypothetical protein
LFNEQNPAIEKQLEQEKKNLATKIAEEINRQGQQGKVFFVNKQYKDYPVLDPIAGKGTSTIKDPTGYKKDINRNIQVDDFSKIDQDAKNGNFKFYIIGCLANTNNTNGTFIIKGAIDKYYCHNKDYVEGKISTNLQQELWEMATKIFKSINHEFSQVIVNPPVISHNFDNKPPYNGNLPFYCVAGVDEETIPRMKAI